MSDATKDLAWDDFRLVHAIAEAKSLPAAAGRLGVNHSTVFRRLGQIEEILRHRLFERHRAGYVPTPAGAEMAAIGARLGDEIVDFTRKVAGREVSPSGELRVTTSDTLLAHLLSPLLVRFRATCPEVQLDIVVSNHALNLSKRDADVAIRASRRPPETLVGRKVGPVAWALYGSSARPAVDPSESPWIGFGDAITGLAAAAATPAERVVYKVSTVLGRAEAIESGGGIGFLPCFIGDSRPTLSRLADPDPAHADDLWILTHPDLRRQPRVRVFMDAMARDLARLKPLLAGQR